MSLIFCLTTILTEFRPLFNRQNFTLFCTFILGLITHRRQATLTEIYQAVRPKSGYGSLVKFLSRGKWDADAVAKRLIQLLQDRFDKWVYVYDETQAIKTGTKQFGLHFLEIIDTKHGTRISRSFTTVISLARWDCFVAPSPRRFCFRFG